MDLLWLKCKTFTCIGSASVPDGGLTTTTRCNRLDAGVVTLTIVLSCVINILLLHIRVLLGIACVCFFSISVSCVHSRVGKVNVTRGLSLLLSLSVASGFLPGIDLFGVTMAVIRAAGVRPSF